MSQASPIPLTMIIPAYQRQRELERALASLAAQDAVPVRTIVVDDASEPPLRLPPGLALPNCTLVRRSVNGGPAAARNTGLALSETEWVSFLDSDDMLVPGTLGGRWRDASEHYARHRDPQVISGCGWIDVSPSGAPLRVRHPLPSDGSAAFASGCWFSPGSCIILNRPAALESAGYQDETLRRLEDFDWFMALGLKGFRFRAQPIVGARIEQKRVQDPKALGETAATIRAKWRAAALPRPVLRRAESYLALECAAAHYHAGHYLGAAAHLVRSFALQPRIGVQLSPGWTIEPPGNS
jgi:hypothetical protein